jgi:hypothetical protein
MQMMGRAKRMSVRKGTQQRLRENGQKQHNEPEMSEERVLTLAHSNVLILRADRKKIVFTGYLFPSAVLRDMV